MTRLPSGQRYNASNKPAAPMPAPMHMATLFAHYHAPFMARYGSQLSAEQHQAIGAIGRYRTLAAGQLQVRCTGCEHLETHPLSCGHRSCPQCQNHEATQWLERQRTKLLPVEYFMVTFILLVAYVAASVAQGISTGLGLWVLAWQCQEDLVAGAVGVAGRDRATRAAAPSGV